MSQTTTATLVLAAGGITAVGQLAHGQLPSRRVVLGTGIVGTVLLLIGGRQAATAASFAALLLVTALLVNGATLATGVLRVLGEQV